MAPETITDPDKIRPVSDIYSLGVLLYELLAGSPPFSKKVLEKAGLMEMRDMASPSTPVAGTPFFELGRK